MTKILLAILFVLYTFSVFAQNRIWSKLDDGKYKVGFRVLSLYDSSRTINNPEGYRPVQVSLWYPAIVTDKSWPMTYKDYFLLSAAETNYQISDALKDSAIINYKRLLAGNGINGDTVDKWFAQKMLAVKDAFLIKGKFPLVVVAQGNYHSVHHQSFLCEFLASNGYVVVTTPSQTRITGQLTDISQAAKSIDDQVKDMEFAINSLKKFENIDFSNIALLGHSFGGRSILLLQMKNKDVKCLVSLDGGLGLNTAVDDIKKSKDYSPSKMSVPLLHFYEDTDEKFLKPDFSLINSFKNSKRFLIKINDMHHFYFSSLGLVYGSLKGFHPLSKNLGEKYKMICHFTRDFLNAVFRKPGSGMKKLKEEFSTFAKKHKFVTCTFK